MYCKCGNLRLNIGCGRLKITDYIGIDIVQIVDGRGNKCVDIVRDINLKGLPFCDDSCDHIIANAFLEHISDLVFVMNECWRCLKVGGILEGEVPLAGTNGAWRDPTHKIFFVEETFDYFCGKNLADEKQPAHPKYANYGFMPWEKILLEIPEDRNGCIHFKLTPKKL
ncbi:MAG: methyltransferase domain-containing protein [bacterium]